MRKSVNHPSVPGTTSQPGPRLGPVLAASVAALLLGGSAAGSAGILPGSAEPVGTESNQLDQSIHDQFLAAFTAEIVDLGPSSVESVKLGE
jgi:hypothetical protein